jgi:lysophospholipase L1-like esterase
VTGWLRGLALRLAPSVLLAAVFALGFLGRPEDSLWLNRSPVWGPGDPFFEASEERFLASPLLIWRGRPGFRGSAAYPFAGAPNPFAHNALGFRDDELAAKPPGTLRVVNLGDSSTWGLNLRERSETYSDQLQALLDARAGPGRFEVVNAGTIGWSSLQGVQFLHHVLPGLDADVVTVYLGNNDSAPARMKDAARVGRRLVPVEAWLSRNAFYLLLRKGILTLRASASRAQWTEFHGALHELDASPAFQSKQAYYERLARATPDEYEANLRSMLALARQAGVRLVLLSVPVNPVWPPAVHPTLERFALRRDQPWSALHVEDGYLLRAWRGEPPGERPLPGHPYLSMVSKRQLAATLGEQEAAATPARLRARLGDAALPEAERLRAAHDLGVWHLIQGEAEPAARLLDDVVRGAGACGGCVPPRGLAQLHHQRGVALLLLGRRDEAFASFAAGRAAWPFALGADYAERFARVAAQPGVEWIDLPARFAEADPVFRGSALIHDWVHPNARGNRVIAEALAERLQGGRPEIRPLRSEAEPSEAPKARR